MFHFMAYPMIEMRRSTGCPYPWPYALLSQHTTLRRPEDRPVSGLFLNLHPGSRACVVQGFSGDVPRLRKLIRFARFQGLYEAGVDERTQTGWRRGGEA